MPQFLAILLLWVAPASQPDDVSIRVMSFNLRYAAADAPNAWKDRRPVMRELFLNRSPDLFGTQEGLADQLADIGADLGENYARIGQGRRGENLDEHCAIFYRSDRFDLLAHGDFWLSDTPEVAGSKSWGNTLARMATWGRFLDRRTGVTFVLFNTHFDHMSENSRRQSAKLLKQKIEALEADIPVIVTGDFNAVAQRSEPWKTLMQTKDLKDAWDAAESKGEEIGTFHNFKGVSKGARIDWILARGASVQQIEIDVHHREGQYPSDHFPVIARITLQPLEKRD